MNGRKARVLVVDDDTSLIDLITSLLEDEGYTVESARNGQDAVNQATENVPDIILLDLHMPVMDGWTCCRTLKRREETSDVPVIVMSAGGDGAAYADLGAQSFLRKPFELGDLLSRVRKYV